MAELIAQFHFLRPWWLLALLPLPLLLWRMQRSQSGLQAWSRLCDTHLLAHLLVSGTERGRRLYGILLGLGWLIGVLALAGPSWSQQLLPVFTNQAARLVLLDLSLSMNAADLKPSRLQRAKFKIADLLDRSQDGQVGLIVYAGDAFTVTPLTADTETIKHLLPVLDTSIMPSSGSRLDLALQHAHKLLQQAGVQQGQVLVFSDSVSSEAYYPQALEAATELAQDGYSVAAVGVGTRRGAPVTANNGELLKNSDGAIVLSQLDESKLRALTTAGQGPYSRISIDAGDLDHILLDLTDTPSSAEHQSASLWLDQGPWLVLLLLPLAALAFRPGWLFVLACMLILPLPRPAQALDWSDLWLRRDQQAAQALTQGNPARALDIATDPWQRGTAAYRLENYEQALNEFAQQPGAQGHYNRGNALALLGRYQEALAAYDEALQAEPDFADAAANREIVEKLLRQQQQNMPEDQTQQLSPDNQQDGDPSSEQEQSGSDQQTQEQQNNPQNAMQQSANNQQDSPGQPQPADQGETQRDLTPEDQQDAQQESKPGEQAGQGQQTVATDDEQPSAEEQQVLEQWLRRIPDDPGGLLRRKFLYQYQRREARSDSSDQPW